MGMVVHLRLAMGMVVHHCGAAEILLGAARGFCHDSK